jgi:hypothetical protein
MKTLIRLMMLLITTRLALANTEDDTPPEGTLEPMDNAATGAVDATQPGTLFLPYGDYPHGQHMQAFDNAAATTMASVLSGQQDGSLITWLKNAFKVGWHRVSKTELPIYAGKHPETDATADAKAYGWVKRIVPMANGAQFDVEYTPEGKALVESRAYRFFSPYWQAIAGKNGKHSPSILESLCLTNRPRIALASLGNAEEPMKEDAATDGTAEHEAVEGETAQPAETEMAKVAAALALAEGSSLADVLTKIQDLATKVAGYEQATAARIAEAVAEAETHKADALQAKGNAEESLSIAQTAADTLRADLSESQRQMQEAESNATSLKALANSYCTALATVGIDAEISAGRVLPAQREGKLAELVAMENAEAVVTALQLIAKGPALIKTTRGLTENTAAGGRLMALANEADTKRQTIREEIARITSELPINMEHKARHDMAWQRLRRERPDLFD